jgi:phosphoribosylformylglycinamidine cyclo-ligase
MPGFYADGEYDVASFIVGAVSRSRVIDGRSIRDGDVLIGLPSSGLHTNGYSLARRIAFETAGLAMSSFVPELGRSIGDVLLQPHRSYLRVITPLLEARALKGMAHITGGGITDNLPRILPDGVHAVIDRSTWQVPAVFAWLQRTGSVPREDMFRTFNMGVGMIIACAAEDERSVLRLLERADEPNAWRIGEIRTSGSGVRYVGD